MNPDLDADLAVVDAAARELADRLTPTRPIPGAPALDPKDIDRC